MGFLLITIIGGVLYALDIVSYELYLSATIGSLVWMYAAAGLYFKFGFLKFFYHNFLHWHVPTDSIKWASGFNVHSLCKHCGENIIQDSQGNWF